MPLVLLQKESNILMISTYVNEFSEPTIAIVCDTLDLTHNIKESIAVDEEMLYLVEVYAGENTGREYCAIAISDNETTYDTEFMIVVREDPYTDRFCRKLSSLLYGKKQH